MRSSKFKCQRNAKPINDQKQDSMTSDPLTSVRVDPDFILSPVWGQISNLSPIEGRVKGIEFYHLSFGFPLNFDI